MGSSISMKGMPPSTAKFNRNPTTKVFTDDDREVQPGSDEVGMVAAGGLVPIGYFKDETKTKEALTADGYVKTGDAGFFDSRTGHLKIIDRAKDVGKLRDGTLFPPKYIENKLKFFPNIREAVAYGDGRDFVSVMLNTPPAMFNPPPVIVSVHLPLPTVVPAPETPDGRTYSPLFVMSPKDDGYAEWLAK